MAKNRAARRLTDRTIAAIKAPPAGQVEIRDDVGPGLHLRIAAGGARTWSVRYSPKGAARRRATIGSYPGLSLAAARAKAYEIAAAAKRGEDLPASDAAQLEEARAAAARPGTVAELLRRYVADYAKANQRRWQLTERMFDLHVIPRLGDKLAVDLRRADVIELLDELRTAKKLAAQVNRVRSQLVAALNWAVDRNFLPGNPAASVRRLRQVETARARVLSDDELATLWRAAVKLGYPSGDLVRFLILTGQRRDEVRGLPWSELRESGAIWLLPAARNKSRRDHELPLPEAARALLAGAPRRGAFVFSARGGKPYAGMKRLKQILDRETKITGWVLHDIRRTVRSRLGEMGIPREIAQRVLNHARPGLDRVYDRGVYHDQVAKALEAWAQRVLRLVDGAANVVEMRPASAIVR